MLARRWVRRVPIGRGPLPSWDETQERRSLRAGYRTAANARKPPLRDLFWPAGCSRHRHADAPSRGECGMREVDCGDDSTVRSTWETRPAVDSWLGTTGCSSAGRRWSWRATSAKPMGSRSPRSLHDSVARRRQSTRTSRTRLMLTKGPAGNGRPSEEVASSGVTRPPRHHEETSFPDGRCSALGWLSSTAGRLGVRMLDRVAERRRAARLARHYRDQEGLSIAEIARRLGRAEATIKAYLYDPTGDKARAVKARYRGVCRGCGAPTAPRNGKGDAYAYCNRAARRPVVSPAQPGGTRRDVLGSDGLPGSER